MGMDGWGRGGDLLTFALSRADSPAFTSAFLCCPCFLSSDAESFAY